MGHNKQGMRYHRLKSQQLRLADSPRQKIIKLQRFHIEQLTFRFRAQILIPDPSPAPTSSPRRPHTSAPAAQCRQYPAAPFADGGETSRRPYQFSNGFAMPARAEPYSIGLNFTTPEYQVFAFPPYSHTLQCEDSPNMLS